MVRVWEWITPSYGWFIVDIHIQMDYLGAAPILGNLSSPSRVHPLRRRPLQRKVQVTRIGLKKAGAEFFGRMGRVTGR